MKDYEDEAFDELEKAQKRKVATGVTDGSNGYGGIERMRLDGAGYRFALPPQPVGAWTLDPNKNGACSRFMVYAKPTDEQIKNTEALLGWKWEDV